MGDRSGGRLFGMGGFGSGGGGGGRLSWTSMRIGGMSLERDLPSASASGRIIMPMKHAKTTGGLPDILEHPAPPPASRQHRGLLPQCLVQRYRRPREQQPQPGREQRASSLCSSYTTSSSRLSRSPSPLSSSYYSSGRRATSSSGSSTTGRRSVLSPTPAPEPAPRRVFPQEPSVADLDGIEDKDESPVVFDVNLSFDLGSPPASVCGGSARVSRAARAGSESGYLTRTRVHQRLVPMAAHLDQQTASAFLTSRIASFLQRTDHVMEEWKRIGRKDPDEELRQLSGGGVARSRSAASIMTRAVKYYKQNGGSGSRCSSRSRASSQVRSPSVSRDDATLSELDELSEMTVDLAEEHSTASLATDRLEVEVADRLRLEKELQDVQGHNKRLQQATERLELELLHARTADLNGVHSDDEGGSGDGDGPSAALRQRYERTLRELEFTKRRLQQQHEDDLEQLVGLKKQLEKKLADAYEEVEEQRQVVGQWKRKVQKLSSETSDLRLLLENQSSRNNLLEKKQRKFDSELQLLQDELRGERQQRERLSREKEIALGEKYSMEQNLSALRLELELKEEKVVSLSRELDELTFGGKTEEEVAQLKKAKHQLEHKCKDQQEELDDLAGQVQLLEQAKLRLEMSLEQLRKEHRKEIGQRDDELEEVRSNAHKKVKALEARLEDEHEERTQLVREKHELERRLGSVEEEWRARRSRDDGQVQRLRRDLRRTRALLTDAQAQLERAKADTPGKAALRGLRNQLEDLELARAQAVKARQLAEQELADVQQQLEDATRLRHESEERANAASRERADLRTQLEENEDELAEVMNKYRAAVHQLSAEQTALQDSVARVAELEQENQSLQDQLAELTARLASAETLGDPSSSLTAKRLELRCKELESRLELEQTTRGRLDTQISRLKETVDKLQSETSLLRAREQSAQDQARKLQRSLREVREEASGLSSRESEALERRKGLEKRLEAAEAEASSARADLKVALQRIDDLQQAIQGDLELDDSSASDNSDNDNDSEASDESIETFLANHNMGSGRLSTANSSKRSSLCERSPRQERTSMFDLSPRLGEPCSTPKEETS